MHYDMQMAKYRHAYTYMHMDKGYYISSLSTHLLPQWGTKPISTKHQTQLFLKIRVRTDLLTDNEIDGHLLQYKSYYLTA